MAKSRKTPAPTSLNLRVLKDVFGAKTRVPNQLEATDVYHLRRCLKAGFVAVEGKELVLTEQGVAGVAGVQ